MKHLPETKNALVLRTDFSDAAAWEAICAAIREPVGEFRAYVHFVSDPAYAGLTTCLMCAGLSMMFGRISPCQCTVVLSGKRFGTLVRTRSPWRSRTSAEGLQTL